jgi:arylsulfatase A-like enzyme
MNAICLIIDRLHAGYVGAYGNTWVHTPQLDRLAAESFLFDQALIDSPRLESLCRSWWQGWHAIRRHDPPPDRPALAELLGSAGVACTLATDEPAIARHPLAAGFQHLVAIDPPTEHGVARSIDRTHLGRCFAQVIDRLDRTQAPFLLWCHLAGLGRAWDAPRKFREAYLEPGDPPPRESADVPELQLDEDYDPDLLLPITQAYAGQVSLLDTCLGALMEFLRESRLAADTLLVLVSARGLALGEHRWVGPCGEPLYAEVVHVPWMIRLPGGQGGAARSQTLVEPSDLWATLLNWWGIEERPETPTAANLMPVVREDAVLARDRLYVVGEGHQQAIRTPAWYLRESGGGDDLLGAELFAKPDDRWEVNDVSNRCRDVVERLREAIAQYAQFIQTGQSDDLPRLEEMLVTGGELG